jgi:hypothetical protein
MLNPDSKEVWGRPVGLAELKDGPLVTTVLDPVVERTTPFRSVLDILHLSPEGVRKWTKSLCG